MHNCGSPTFKCVLFNVLTNMRLSETFLDERLAQITSFTAIPTHVIPPRLLSFHMFAINLHIHVDSVSVMILELEKGEPDSEKSSPLFETGLKLCFIIAVVVLHYRPPLHGDFPRTLRAEK